MSLVVATYNERCNNASALVNLPGFRVGQVNLEYGAENLTGLNNQPIPCWLINTQTCLYGPYGHVGKFINLGRRTFRNGRCAVFHCIDELKREC